MDPPASAVHSKGFLPTLKSGEIKREGEDWPGCFSQTCKNHVCTSERENMAQCDGDCLKAEEVSGFTLCSDDIKVEAEELNSVSDVKVETGEMTCVASEQYCAIRQDERVDDATSSTTEGNDKGVCQQKALSELQSHGEKGKNFHEGGKTEVGEEFEFDFDEIFSKFRVEKPQIIHAEEKSYSCNECGRGFPYKYKLKEHNRIHTGEKPYPCNECGKSFSNASGLKSHKLIHMEEKLHTCNECGKGFRRRYELRRHQRRHTGEKPYSCSECGKGFRHTAGLKFHKRIHTGEKPYSCDECGKCLYSTSGMKSHQLMHMEEKPHTCNECGKSFRWKYELRRHQRMHSEEKRHSCSACGRCFIRLGNFKRHQSVHTGEKPDSKETKDSKGTGCEDTEAEDTFEETSESDHNMQEVESQLSPGELQVGDSPAPPQPNTSRTPHPRTRRVTSRPLYSSSAEPEDRWRDLTEADQEPVQHPFCPTRTPGVQLDTTGDYTALELFKLFFSVGVVTTFCANTNANGQQGLGKGRVWSPVSVQEMYRYLSLVIYMGMLQATSYKEYWRQDRLFSLPFPCKVMSGDRYESITQALHLSNPGEDEESELKKGSAGYDKLFQLRPLLDSIQSACRAFYHPFKNIAISERMVATEGQIGLKQYMKSSPTKCGFKVFILVDSKNGYTFNFNVCQGMSPSPSGKGLSFDTVVDLLSTADLGTGYHIYMDNLYTSPVLFKHLHSLRYGACGTIRENRLGFPRTKANALPKNAQQGDMRWIRTGELLYTQWMDTREVRMCSTIHKAFSKDFVQRCVKIRNGQRETKRLPVPTPVKAYNQHMGGVDFSDALLKYYTASRNTCKWYKKLFYHLVDLAVVNSFILHQEIALSQKAQPVTRRKFREDLCLELSLYDKETTVSVKSDSPTEPSTSAQGAVDFVDCMPVTIVDTSNSDPANKATNGWGYCGQCCKGKLRIITIWKCHSCDVPLCLVPDRNCFQQWHMEKKLPES